MKLQLETTSHEFHDAHLALDKCRRSSESVKVSRQTLGRLLRDHSKMVSRLQGDVTEPGE
ncbi:MAG TPA: hypothetical protein VF194_19610 [Ferrovibrio sp.]|uniref:hypothetical protein n=1 Tax=Ferrovibrio sp. TaxID=1917215 RepID=UPI002ED6B1FD